MCGRTKPGNQRVQHLRGDVTILPTLVVNNRQYRGKLAKGSVLLKAICSGFEETTEPSVCLSGGVETNECKDKIGGCWQDKSTNITACKDTFCGRVCECPLVDVVQFKGDGYSSCVGAMEGINQIVTGSLTSLSEQELVDCDKSYNSGCGGGLMDYVYQFVVKNKGIDTEEDYPYQTAERSCNKNKLNRHVVTIDGYIDVPEKDEKQLLQAVAAQPVSVGICGSERGFQLYSKGIFTGPCSTYLDHAVLIVGYGSENGVDYWIVKNSWGKQWGMDGYMYMQRNSGNPEGICGINMMASYPTKTSPNPPPSPSPGPTKCSLLTSCSEGETCCCSWRLLGVCLSWKCCEINSAVCCKDNHHCCPHDYPVCDNKKNMCLKQTGNYTAVKELGKQRSSGKLGGWSSLLRDWNF